MEGLRTLGSLVPLVKSLVGYGKALSDPLTIRVIVCLLGADLGTESLVAVLRISRSQVSARIQRLRDLQILEADRIGQQLSFRIRPTFQNLLQQTIDQLEPDLAWHEQITADSKRLKVAKRASREESSRTGQTHSLESSAPPVP